MMGDSVENAVICEFLGNAAVVYLANRDCVADTGAA
jgi:hypothetical protein